jgi:outer membrane protein
MIKRALFLSFLLLAFAASAFAQPAGARPAATPGRTTTAAPPAPAPAGGAPQTVALPMSKMAVIYTDLFLDEKTGIQKFTIVIKQLNGQFQPLKDELNTMNNRAQALEAEINKLREAPPGTPIDQTALQTKVDQLEQLKRDIQRKAEDAQNAYNKQRNVLLQPLQMEIGKALEAFAKARGINVIIDGAQVPLLYAIESTDITRAFITEFNSKNPVTAATTPPK